MSFIHSDCYNNLKINILQHQKNVCNFITKEHNKGILIFHSVGSGKTITSLIIAKCLSIKYPNKNIIILTGKSLIQNFEKDIIKSGININENKLLITSYVKFINSMKYNNDNVCKNNILIIDEAQNFGRTGSRSSDLLKCAKKAFKVILLSATPVKNNPIEIAHLISMISSNKKLTIAKIRDSVIKLDDKSLDAFKDIFKCKVSYFDNIDRSKYPTSEEHIISFTMSMDYYKEYYQIQENNKDDHLPSVFTNAKNLIPFLNGVRRAVNSLNLVSPKIEWSLRKIITSVKHNKKVLLYSAWKVSGIEIIKKMLDVKNITFNEITGDISKDLRTQYVNDYNSGKTKVMLITSAGSEGLDLKETRCIIILEPHWNQSKIDQVIGRGIRYESHIDLPKYKRHVDIYYLILKKPDWIKRYWGDGKIPSADMMLLEMSKNKDDRIKRFYSEIKKISIENDRDCSK